MTVMLINKETEQEIVYKNAGYDTHGAIETENGFSPVFQLCFEDGTTATFQKKDWDLFVLKRV